MRQVGFAIRGAIICLAFLTVTANAWADTVTLVWDPSPDPSVTGYYVYVGAEPGVYDHRYDVGNTTSFVYLDGAVDRRYYFAVAAYVPGPLLSSLSNEVSWLSN